MTNYLSLPIILLIGSALRLARLDSKPLWADEIFTAIFSLGGSFDNIPFNQIISLSRIPSFFSLNPEASCRDIAHNLTVQSTHPPLFFCLMHAGLVRLSPFDLPLAWKLRILPAFLGILAIAAIYLLNRVAFSPAAGLMGGALAAVSPFGVYQSQEARHYTLPILLITIALIFLLQLQQDLQKQRIRPWIGMGWAMANTLGLYVHYFCAIAFLAQVLTLIAYAYRLSPHRFPSPTTLFVLSFSLLPPLLYLPWLPILIEHFNSPKAGWLPPPQHIVPLLRMLLATILMVVVPPVEEQPLWVSIPAIVLTLVFLAAILPPAWRGLKRLATDPKTRDSTFILVSFILFVLLQFLAIVYILGKDITVAPRYHFLYYPALCALLGASCAQSYPNSPNSNDTILSPHPPLSPSPPLPWLLLSVSFVSSLCVITNLAFVKPYYPLAVAQKLNRSSGFTLVVMGYSDTQQIALGLSYALALERLPKSSTQTRDWMFIDSSQGLERVWGTLSEQSISPDNLWIFGPGLIREQYPQRLSLQEKTQCLIDPQEHYRIGIPYQLYRCRQHRAGLS
ncbi:MAG: glycosyltransferase family 39 protein [Cyanobacteriota bacterium]|nr:glycosyltransferase family 39 protein [Cyanobacteriota bacterium]